MIHRLLDERIDFFSFLRLFDFLFGKFEGEALSHQREPGELLPKVVVQVQGNPPAFLLGDLEQLILEAFALANGGMQFCVRGLQLGGTLMNA